jgi:hypothetical protein
LLRRRANVRRTGGNDGIKELAASMPARGKYKVIAGRERCEQPVAAIGHYLALSMLSERRLIPADHPVLCHVLTRDADATEIGLDAVWVRTGFPRS